MKTNLSEKIVCRTDIARSRSGQEITLISGLYMVSNWLWSWYCTQGCPTFHWGFPSWFDKLKYVSGCHVENKGLDYATYFQMNDPVWSEWIISVCRTCLLFLNSWIKHYSWKPGDISKAIDNFCSFCVDLFLSECHMLAGVEDGSTGCSFCGSFILESFLLLKTCPVALGRGRGREGDFILPRAGCQDLWALLLEWRGENVLCQWGCSLHRQPGRAQGPCSSSRANLCFTPGCPSASTGCTWRCKVFASPKWMLKSESHSTWLSCGKKKKFL